MTTKNKFFRLLLIFFLVLSGCSKNPDINNATMLDGDQIFDPSLYNPELYLVSVAIANPTEIQKIHLLLLRYMVIRQRLLNGMNFGPIVMQKPTFWFHKSFWEDMAAPMRNLKTQPGKTGRNQL